MKKVIYIFTLIGSMAFHLHQEGAQEKAIIQAGSKPASEKAVSKNPQTQPTATVSSTAPEITFTETTHEFGTVKKGSPVVYSFSIKIPAKNRSLFLIVKLDAATTPKCSKEPVKAGKTGFIEVHYDSMRAGNFGKEVTVTSNAKNSYVNLVIKGTITGETEGTDTKHEEEIKFPPEKHK